MQQASGRWKLGFAFALATSIIWSTLPLGLEVALVRFDPKTATWLRFLVSALILGAWLASRGKLPPVRSFSRRTWLLLMVCLVGMIGNYLIYAYALQYVSPTVNQTVIQIAPMLLLAGGVFFLGESFGVAQRAGLALLVVGLGLFFNQRLGDLRAMSGDYFIGVALLVLASGVWAIYGLAQKSLLRVLGGQQLLWLLYVGSTLVLTPLIDPSRFQGVAAAQAVAIAYCCLNTLLGYGAFVAAMENWEVSRVGAVLATAPIFTLGAMWVTHRLWPGLLRPESFNALAILGALIVVAGSIVSALGNRPATD